MTDTETHKANQKLLAMITRNPLARQSWRDVLPIHPAADLFPFILWAENAEDADDLTKVQLLDGRNRLDAMELLGVQLVKRGKLDVEAIGMFANVGCFFETRSDGDPYELALSLNAHRRHLDADQKRKLIAKVLKAKPEKSNRHIASELGYSHVTVGAVRDELVSTGQIDQLEKTKGKDGKSRPARKPKAKASKEMASKAKAEQKSFDSPEEAHASKTAPKISKQEMKALSDSWRSVHEQIRAGNRTRLKDALELHREKIDRVLEGLAP